VAGTIDAIEQVLMLLLLMVRWASAARLMSCSSRLVIFTGALAIPTHFSVKKNK